MKHLFTIICALALTTSLSGQQLTAGDLVSGNSDVIGLDYSANDHFLVESGPTDFYWVGASYQSSVAHPYLDGIDPAFSYLYFVKYDENGTALAANHIQGPYWVPAAYSYDEGITIFGVSYADVVAGENFLPKNQASSVEFLASYDGKGELNDIVPIWDPGPSGFLNTVSMMDKRDGSIYIAGSTHETLTLAGYGPIGEIFDNYFYVVKYNRNLAVEKVFTAGFDDAEGTEYGQYSYNSFAISPDGKGSVWITGTHEGDRSPVIGGDTLSGSFESLGVFAVKLNSELKKERVLSGSMNGYDQWETHIIEGLALDNGDVVMMGETTTGYFSLGDAEFKFTNGSDYYNLFAFRLTPEGDVAWERPVQTMLEFYGEKKGSAGTKGVRKVQSESFEQNFHRDATMWKNETLYMTGLFNSDTFEINGKVMNKRFFYGAFVAAIDMNTGAEKWGYSLSSNNLHLYGFDLDNSGNPTLMGSAEYYLDLDYLATDSLGPTWIFHLGLDYSGKPLWKSNAYTQGMVGGFRGCDLEVLRDGKVFSSIVKMVQEPLVIGGGLVNSAESITAMMIPLKVDNKVGGLLFSKAGATVNPGSVKAYKATESGAYPVVSEAGVDASGYYFFEGLFPGKYKFLAEPDPKAYPDGMPTYYGGAVSWDQARDVLLETDTRTTFTDITLSELPKLTAEDGSGQMSGNVSYEDDVVSKGTKGRPATKTSVILKRKASEVKKSTLEEDIVAYVDTDDLGNYEFDNVPDGAYTLIVDIPGLPMIQTYEVEILANKIISGLDFLVKNKGIETSGSVDVERVAIDQFMIFPNPGKGLLNIEFTTRGDYSVQVYNLVGRLIDSRDFLSMAGLTQMDISHLQRGMYLLKIEGDQGVETVKYLKE